MAVQISNGIKYRRSSFSEGYLKGITYMLSILKCLFQFYSARFIWYIGMACEDKRITSSFVLVISAAVTMVTLPFRPPSNCTQSPPLLPRCWWVMLG